MNTEEDFKVNPPIFRGFKSNWTVDYCMIISPMHM